MDIIEYTQDLRICFKVFPDDASLSNIKIYEKSEYSQSNQDIMYKLTNWLINGYNSCVLFYYL